MDSKLRAALLAQANTLQATVQVGKGGVSPALLAQVLDDFRTRELVKIKALLETVPEPPRVLAEKIAGGTGSQVVRIVGGSIVLYKENPDLKKEKARKKSSAAKQTKVGIRARKLKTVQKEKREKRERGAAGGFAKPKAAASGASAQGGAKTKEFSVKTSTRQTGLPNGRAKGKGSSYRGNSTKINKAVKK